MRRVIFDSIVLAGGGLASFLFGELDGLFYALVAVVILDYITGVLEALVNKNLSSRVGFSGIVKKVFLFVIVAIATGLLIYNSMTKPKYHKEADTIVEDFREWQDETHERKQMRRAISSALWSIITALYFVISFTTNAWHITWVIWIIGCAIESLIEVFLSMKKNKK